MSQSPKEPRNLQDILQQWGAHEALEEARSLHLHLPRMQQLPFGHPMLAKLRWWAIAGGIIMVIGVASAAMWYAMHLNKLNNTGRPASSPASQQAVPMDDSLYPASSRPADEESVRQLHEKVRSLVKELSELRKMHDESLKASQQAQAELAALKAQRDVTFNDLQSAFLDAFVKNQGEDGDRSLVARQTAARALRLLDRVSAVRSAASSQACRNLVDRLDAVLTQLDMVEADKADGVKSMRILTEGGEMMQLLDASAGTPGENPAVRAWLLEVKLVLAGVERG